MCIARVPPMAPSPALRWQTTSYKLSARLELYPKLAKNTISLPVHEFITDKEIKYVTNLIKDFWSKEKLDLLDDKIKNIKSLKISPYKLAKDILSE